MSNDSSSQNVRRVPMIEKILSSAISANASDIHLVVGLPPTIRVHGELLRLQTSTLAPEDTLSYTRSLATERFQTELNETGACNFSFEAEGRAFRAVITKDYSGNGIVLRLISNNLKSPQELGIAQSVIDAVSKSRGLVLATGATGSGKSTTLASLINMLTLRESLRIVSVERPIEYRFLHNRSVVSQREVPLHTRGFSEALHDALRQDPDVIFIGELRSREEMRVAIEAAETGHLVLSTVHTNTAAEAIDRIVLNFPAEDQSGIRMVLSTSLLAVVSQVLVPRKGEPGRVLVHEVLTRTAAVSHLIREGRTERIPTAIQTGRKEGMLMFDDHLVQRVHEGLVEPRVAVAYARDPKAVAQRLRGQEVRDESDDE